MITKQHFFFGVPGACATISPGGFRTGIRGAASLSPTALRYTPRLRARLEYRWVVDPVTGTANALTQNAPGTGEATAFHGARVIAMEFAPTAQ